jgi:integrase
MQQFIVTTKTRRPYKDEETGKTRTKTVKVETPILSPEHFETLLSVVRDDRLSLTIRILLGSGIRYEELSQISRPNFYPDNKSVRIVSLKERAVIPDRYVSLSTDGCRAVREWIDGGFSPMSRIGFYDHLKKLYPKTGLLLTSKSFRKTVEIWRMKAGHNPLEVAYSQGHTSKIQAGHYFSGIPFTPEQVEKIKELTS